MRASEAGGWLWSERSALTIGQVGSQRRPVAQASSALKQGQVEEEAAGRQVENGQESG